MMSESHTIMYIALMNQMMFLKGVFKTRNGEMTKWRNGEMVLKIRAKVIRYNHSHEINISYKLFCCVVSLSCAVF